jgi:tetratricopeptide (TPR) repeat protein
VNDAYLLKATRFVHGYFTGRDGSLRFAIEVEDTSRHKMVSSSVATGGVLDAMDAAAPSLAPVTHAFSTTNAEAVTAWGHGDDERAVAIDPDFGTAWLDWVQKLAATGNTPQATETAQRALARPTLRSPVDRARIRFETAVLRKDAAARERALVELARLEPADEAASLALAQAEFNARHFRDAAAQYRNLLRLDPANAAAMNSLGYAEAYSGELDAARKSFEEYGQQPGQKTNSLDSLGEAFFVNGRFTDAEKYFMAAYQSNPSFLGGADLLKAAYARWLAGDLVSADASMKSYLEFRAKLHDPLIVWREASWDFTTGRGEQAIAKLQNAPPNQKDLAEKQTAVWRGTVPMPNDLTALHQSYEQTEPASDGEARTFYAAALFAAGRKEEARALVALWPLPDSAGDPLFQSLVYPEFIELRKGLK